MPLTRRQWSFAAAGAALSCGGPPAEEPVAAEPEKPFLERVHVIDLHCDTPMLITDHGYDLGVRHGYGQVDIPRLKEGGYTGVFFSVYCPGAKGRTPEKYAEANRIIDAIEAEVARHPEDLFIATTAADIERAKAEGKIAILMGVEGGHMIDSNLENLRALYQRGGRYMTLTHSVHTPWAGSSGGDAMDDPGLTDFGHEVVAEMNRLGMMVDLSHVSDKTFLQTLNATKAPAIASHSSCRALADHPRNMTDAMITELADKGGVVHINYYNAFIDEDYRARSNVWDEANPDIFKGVQQAYADDPEARAKELAELRRRKFIEIKRTPLSVLVDHFAHVVNIAGVEHVGLGSDFDGVSDALPEGMEDCSKTMNLVEGLRGRGLSDDDVAKILGENTLRVMRDVEAAAVPDADSTA